MPPPASPTSMTFSPLLPLQLTTGRCTSLYRSFWVKDLRLSCHHFVTFPSYSWHPALMTTVRLADMLNSYPMGHMWSGIAVIVAQILKHFELLCCCFVPFVCDLILEFSNMNMVYSKSYHHVGHDSSLEPLLWSTHHAILYWILFFLLEFQVSKLTCYFGKASITIFKIDIQVSN